MSNSNQLSPAFIHGVSVGLGESSDLLKRAGASDKMLLGSLIGGLGGAGSYERWIVQKL